MNEDMIRLSIIARTLDENGRSEFADRIDGVMSRMAEDGYRGRMLGRDVNTGGDWYEDARGNFFYRGGDGDEWKQYSNEDGRWEETPEDQRYVERGSFLPNDIVTNGRWYQDEVGNHWYQAPGSDSWKQYENKGGRWEEVGPSNGMKTPSETGDTMGIRTIFTPGGKRIFVGPDGEAHSEEGRPLFNYNGNWYNLGTTDAVDEGIPPLFDGDSSRTSRPSPQLS